MRLIDLEANVINVDQITHISGIYSMGGGKPLGHTIHFVGGGKLENQSPAAIKALADYLGREGHRIETLTPR